MLVSINSVTKEYNIRVSKSRGFPGRTEKKKVTAVKSLSFNVDENVSLALIGPNGAGKTTTVKLLTGLLTPNEGSISIGGYDVQKNMKKLSYYIGTLFGHRTQLIPNVSIYDSLKLLGAIYDIEKKTLDKRISDLIELVGIEDVVHKKSRKLSLGQRMKCELVASMLHSPKLLLLDEPTIGLDIIAKSKFRNTIKDVIKNTSTSVIISSHDVMDISSICSHSIVLRKGEKIFDGKISELTHLSSTRQNMICEYASIPEFKNLRLPGNAIIKDREENRITIEYNPEEISMGNLFQGLIHFGNIISVREQESDLETVLQKLYQGESK
ncbi:MAG: Vitamin B12 import ATP-binding protein BtuD [Candidatus Celerinatantimonas neptuna]|nr:MAG: Vitamin B12 import ATP-binding protein BtuD [Candidatus Celerinatantimonas neptuna]